MEQTTLWSHHVVLPASALSAAHARAFVVQWLVEHRLLYLVDEVRLVASELATNAVVHAGTDFTVWLDGSERSVRLTVSDGSPTAPTRVPHVPDELLPAGRGLHIVNMISEHWGVEKQEGATKSVWATFQVRPTPGFNQDS
jgi:anti-sigma regulatory factor (Ser/Thr protein kinase)